MKVESLAVWIFINIHRRRTDRDSDQRWWWRDSNWNKGCSCSSNDNSSIVFPRVMTWTMYNMNGPRSPFSIYTFPYADACVSQHLQRADFGYNSSFVSPTLTDQLGITLNVSFGWITRMMTTPRYASQHGKEAYRTEEEVSACLLDAVPSENIIVRHHPAAFQQSPQCVMERVPSRLVLHPFREPLIAWGSPTFSNAHADVPV